MLTFKDQLDMRLWSLGLSKRWVVGHMVLIRTKCRKVECFNYIGFILN